MPKDCDPNNGSDMLDLERLISAYIEARGAWLGTTVPNGDLVADGNLFEIFETASRAVLRHACATPDAVRRKVALVLESTDLYTMMREDEDDGCDLLRVFLSSLISCVPASEPRH